MTDNDIDAAALSEGRALAAVDRREAVGKRFNCPKGLCDQRRACAFFCWWNPHSKALSHQADAHRERRP